MCEHYTNGEPSKIIIPHSNGECTLEDVQFLLSVAEEKMKVSPFLSLQQSLVLDLTIVQALINKIIDLETNKIFPAMG